MSQDGPPPDPQPTPYDPYPPGWGQPTPGRPPAPDPSPYGQASPYPDLPQPPPVGGPPSPPGDPRRPAFVFAGYAPWITRVGASFIDALLGTLAGLPYLVGEGMRISTLTTITDGAGVRHVHMQTSATAGLLILIGSLTYLAFFIWNVIIRQGRTGATYGKSVLAIRVVFPNTMQPIGPGWAILRYLLHILDALACGLGYLWPIWDAKKQTFADKIMGTVVITANEPRPY